MSKIKTHLQVFLFLTIIFLDQLSKYLVRTRMFPGQSVKIFSFLDLTYLTNTGVAFSMFQGANLFFIFFSLAVLTGIIIWYNRSLKDMGGVLSLAVLLIVSGAFGNLIDRVVHGHVIDFVDVSLGSFHWPSFNVADSCITIGGIILFLSLFGKDHVPKPV
jgi:signal peptidase II